MYKQELSALLPQMLPAESHNHRRYQHDSGLYRDDERVVVVAADCWFILIKWLINRNHSALLSSTPWSQTGFYQVPNMLTDCNAKESIHHHSDYILSKHVLSKYWYLWKVYVKKSDKPYVGSEPINALRVERSLILVQQFL